MGTLLLVLGLIFTAGGLYLVGHEALLMGRLQTVASSVAPATVQSIKSWCAVKLGPNFGEIAGIMLDWPRAPVLTAIGVVFLTIGWRMSHSRRNMN